MAEEKQEKPQEQKKPTAKVEQRAGVSATAAATSIIRIAGKDINGNFRIQKALNQVRGIGTNLASAIATVAENKFSISKETRIGSLSDEQLSKIEQIIKDPAREGIPIFMLNRKKDPEGGRDMHLVGSDLIVSVKQDIDRDVRIQTWRGFRHQYGQKVRGQRTRSTGRTGATVGVTKKAAAEAAKAAQAAQAGAAKKEAPKK